MDKFEKSVLATAICLWLFCVINSAQINRLEKKVEGLQKIQTIYVTNTIYLPSNPNQQWQTNLTNYVNVQVKQ